MRTQLFLFSRHCFLLVFRLFKDVAVSSLLWPKVVLLNSIHGNNKKKQCVAFTFMCGRKPKWWTVYVRYTYFFGAPPNIQPPHHTDDDTRARTDTTHHNRTAVRVQIVFSLTFFLKRTIGGLLFGMFFNFGSGGGGSTATKILFFTFPGKACIVGRPNLYCQPFWQCNAI